MAVVDQGAGRPAQGRKVEQILKEINELKGPIERTLMDVREILAALDNPLRSTPAPEEQTAEPDQRKGRPDGEAVQRPQQRQARPPTGVVREGFDTLTFNVFACTELLTKLLGRWQLERLLLGMEGEDAEEVRLLVRRALESLSAVEPLPD
ncbi:MAG: hypothetical protein ABDH63_06855 [Candidatus Caldarchaeales archaeon]